MNQIAYLSNIIIEIWRKKRPPEVILLPCFRAMINALMGFTSWRILLPDSIPIVAYKLTKTQVTKAIQEEKRMRRIFDPQHLGNGYFTGRDVAFNENKRTQPRTILGQVERVPAGY